MSASALNPEFWRGKRVFLTGHTGFKGSWLTFILDMLGAEVAGFALAPDSKPNMFEALDIESLCSSVIGDIKDTALVRAAVEEAKPQIVIHMAAQSLVRRSYQEPVDTFATNVIGTVNVLDACRGVAGVQGVLVVTTDKCYENLEQGRPFRESDPLGGDDPYSASKACAEIVTGSYRQSFFKGDDGDAPVIASARSGNVIGGGDWSEDRLVPDFVRAVYEDQPLMLRMPNAVRPWQHVLEPLAGYMACVEACCTSGRAFGKAWNFGPTAAQFQSVRDVAAIASELTGRERFWSEAEAPPALKEAMHLTLDSTRAETELAWRSKLGIRDTLDLTMAWYDAFYSGKKKGDLRELTKYQVLTYFDRGSAIDTPPGAAPR